MPVRNHDLDANQTLQNAYDADTNRFRVDAEVQATMGDLEVAIDHTEDSIKVGDGTDFLTINADGSINITDNGASLTVDATDLDIRNLSNSQDSIAVYGTDGSTQRQLKTNTAGDLRIEPNTSRERILQANDLIETYTWLDFATKDQRISTIVYSSVTVGSSATKTYAYTLTGGQYRLDTITWS